LGNLVPQLHVHVVGRAPGDEAWPGPVWGGGEPEAYPGQTLSKLVTSLHARLA
jgi:diadenosine tetraphosphate (Ap4A) HIT family hydrolase